jgi:hypothetical protein
VGNRRSITLGELQGKLTMLEVALPSRDIRSSS